MGSARKTPVVTASSVSLERAARLYRLVGYLGDAARTRSQILAKLNAGTRTEAVTVGIRKGLILL